VTFYINILTDECCSN